MLRIICTRGCCPPPFWPPRRGLARRGNGPCAILTLRPGAVAGRGPATARLPGSHWEGWWGMQRQWRALPAAAPNCLQSRSPAKAPPRAATCSQPHSAHSRCVWPAALVITCAQAQLIMLLAALHQTADTFLHSPHDALPSSIPRTPASLRHPVATFIPKCVHLVINSTLLNPPQCSILSFAPLHPRPARRGQCGARRLPGHRRLSRRSTTPRKSNTLFQA